MKLFLMLLLAMPAGATPFYDYAAKGDAESDNRAKINLYSHALAAWAAPDYLEDKSALFVRRGNAHEALNEWEAALADLDAANRITPKDYTVHSGRANVFAGMKRCAESIKEDKIALELAEPAHHGSLHMDMGHTQKDCARNLPAAVREFQAAIAAARVADNENIMTRSAIALGGVLCLQHKYDHGIDILDKVKAGNPQNVTALYELGICHQSRGELNSAASFFTQAIDIVKPKHSGDESREVSRRSRGEYQVTSSSDGGEKLSDCYYRRGQIERKNGADRAAVADFREACRLGKKAACRASSSAE